MNDFGFRDSGFGFRRRRGIALVITLVIMALLLIMATAFVVNMRVERATAKAFTDEGKARDIALAGLHTAIAQLDSYFTEAATLSPAAPVATMAGRLYYGSRPINGTGNPTETSRDLFSISRPGQQASILLPNGTPLTNSLANLNAGAYDPNNRRYLPIANPATTSPADIQRSQINAQWIPIWNTPNNTVDTRNNRRVGRFAFWMDDESAKVNLVNAYTRGSGPGWNGAGGLILPQNGNPTNIHHSSIDLAAFDNPVGSGRPGWGQDIIGPIDRSRNPAGLGNWLPLLSPEEVLGMAQSIGLSAYQNAKYCLTAWGVDSDNRRTFDDQSTPTTPPRPRISLNQLPAGNQQQLFTNIREAMRDNNLSKFYAVNSVPNAFAIKYADTAQPFLNGGVDQIAANIITYIRPRNQPAYGADGLTGNTIPSGPCGLRKAAYMNEIVIGAWWQRVGTLAAPQWQLWAAAYVELINPYEVPMPRGGEQYRISVDAPFVIVGTTTATPPGLTGTLPTQALTIGGGNSIPARQYSTLSANLIIGPSRIGQPLTSPVTGQPPQFTLCTVTLPPIRLLKGTAGSDIIDWFNPQLRSGTYTSPLTLRLFQGAQPTGFSVNQPIAQSEILGQNNPLRVSIGKNDPRVHAWFPQGQNGLITTRITINGQNQSSGQNPALAAGGTIDFTGGDLETTADPASWSNFRIGEGPMQSIGELGYIHTGRPWRSIALQPMSVVGDTRAPNNVMPDWAILDMFTANREPVHGRININGGDALSAGWHFGFPALPATLLSSTPNLLPRRVVSNPTIPANSPLAAVLFDPTNIGASNARFRDLLNNILNHRSNGGGRQLHQYAYFTIGEICEVFGIHYNSWGGSSAPTSGFNTSNQTDEGREDVVRKIINLVTTRSNTFTVWVVAQSIYSPQANNATLDQVLSESRLMAVIERFTPIVTGGGAAGANPAAPKYRVRYIRFITD